MSKPTKGARVAACLTCLLLASSVRAVDIRGTVRSSEEPKARTIEAIRAPYWQEWNGFIDPKKPSIDLAREVSAVLIGPTETRDATTITLRGGTLTPSTLAVQHGTTLRIRNEDDFAHELFAERIKDFDPKTIGPGQTRSVSMSETGVFEVRDKLSPHVRGFLHVLTKVSRVVSPAADGSFVFEDVPPGDYVVKIFRGVSELEGGTLAVASRGDAQLEPVDVRPTAVKPGK